MPEIGEVVTLSMLNNGMAADIFDEVKRTGTRVVVNEHNEAVGLIVAPLDYVEIAPEFRDDKGLQIAVQRMKKFERGEMKTVSQEEVDRHWGITEKDLEGWEDIEFDYGDEQVEQPEYEEFEELERKLA